MPNSNKINSVKCPACGAPIQMNEARVICDYWGSVLEREQPLPTISSQEVQEPQVVIIEQHYADLVQQSQAGGSSCLPRFVTYGLLLGAVGILACTLFPTLVAGLLRQVGLADVAFLTHLPERIINKATIGAMIEIDLLPSGNDTDPDFLTFVYDNDSSTYRLTYVEAANSDLRWQSPPLEEYYNTKLAVTAETIYFTDATKLYAVNRADGQTVWQSSLADKIPSSCSGCFILMADHLIVLVEGRSIQAFNTKNGQSVWSQRLNFEYTGHFIPVGETLLIVDRSQDNRQTVMSMVDPATGEGGAIPLPQCADQSTSLDPLTLQHTGRAEVIFLFNKSSRQPCLQIWDVGSQTMSQEILLDGLSMSINISPLRDEEQQVIQVGDVMYLAANQRGNGADEDVIVRVNLTDGQWDTVAQQPDYTLLPLTTVDDVLLVRAVRNRGTERNELWGIDLTTGEAQWQYVLQASRQPDDLGSGGVWDWHLVPAGLAVVQVLEDPDQLTVDVLDPQTGVSSGQKTIPVSDTFFSDLAWTNDAVWLALRQIYKVDLASGAVSYRWP